MYDAINRFFRKSPKWSLCDMAYKYVVLLDGTTDMVVQDSYALTVLADVAPSCARCLFCPVCFIDPPAPVPGQDPMHSHIVDIHQDAYYMADAKSFAVMTPPVSLPGSTTQSAATSAAASVATSSSASAPGSVPSVASSTASFDPARTNPPSTASNTSSEDAAFEAARQQTNNHIHMASEELKTEIKKPETASDAQADLSQANYDKLRTELAAEKAARAKDAADNAAKDALIKTLEDNIQLVTEALAQQTDTLALETTDKKAFEDKLKALEDEHAAAKKQHEEDKKTHADEKKSLEDENQQQKDDAKRAKSDHATDLTNQLKPVQDENEALKQAQATLQQNIAALEANNKEVADLMRELGEKNAEIAALKARIAALELELADALATTTRASTAGDAELQTLKDALIKANDDLTASQAELVAAHSQADLAQAELARQQNKLQHSNTRIAELQTDLAAALAGLDAAVKVKRSTLKHVQDTISNNVQQQMSLAQLTQMLEAKEYTRIRDVVEAGAALSGHKKTIYTAQALFLILESMGATWCAYRKRILNVTKPDEAKQSGFDLAASQALDAWNADLLLVCRQMVYDLTMWYSMQNTPKHTRYASAHVTSFITEFGLNTNERLDGKVESSDDDDAPGPAPPEPEEEEEEDEEEIDLSGLHVTTPPAPADAAPAPAPPGRSTSIKFGKPTLPKGDKNPASRKTQRNDRKADAAKADAAKADTKDTTDTNVFASVLGGMQANTDAMTQQARRGMSSKTVFEGEPETPRGQPAPPPVEHADEKTFVPRP
jgi:predicted  nucleic acid-binding Zn-ribbon protein